VSNDFAQLAQWRAYRIAQQQIVAWNVLKLSSFDYHNE
jgi:hypothetical protein